VGAGVTGVAVLGWRCWGLQAVVDSGAEVFAWFEIGDVLAGELNWVAGFGVAAHARGAVVEGEAAEAANFYALIADQG